MRLQLLTTIALLAQCMSFTAAAPASRHVPQRAVTKSVDFKPLITHVPKPGNDDDKVRIGNGHPASSLSLDSPKSTEAAASPEPTSSSEDSDSKASRKSNARVVDYSVLPKKFVPKSNKFLPKNGSALGKKTNAKSDVESIARQFVAGETKGDASNFSVRSNRLARFGATRVHLQETYNKLPIVNLAHSVVLDSKASVLFASVARVDAGKHSLVSSNAKSISAVEAVAKVATTLGFKAETSRLQLTGNGKNVTGAPFLDKNVKVAQKLYYLPSGKLDKVWELRTRIAKDGIYRIWVSQSTGEILGAQNMYHRLRSPKATGKSVTKTSPKGNSVDLERRGGSSPRGNKIGYRAVPFNKNNVAEGRELITDAPDFTASPKGWHDSINVDTSKGQYDTRGQNYTTTGNNIHAATDYFFDPAQSVNGKFDFSFDPNADVEPNLNAALTNLFYIGNKYHDVFYQYGFVEDFYNFQVDNFGKGGYQYDPVMFFALDDFDAVEDLDLPGFYVDEDGVPMEIYMQVNTFTSAPARDLSFDNNVVIHMLSHGLISRIACLGYADCLDLPESFMVEEGLADIFAIWSSAKKTDTDATDRAFAAWAFDDANGMRTSPYSTSLTRNTRKYSDAAIDELLGAEAFASMMFEVYWNMVNQAGFESNLSSVSSSKGNIWFMQLVIATLMIISYEPTMADFRDGMLLWDFFASDGQFYCAIQTGFAKRGLGLNVVDDGNFVDDFTIDPVCV
ncbi:hypothetical protein HDU97_004143 [Phlyctochytrium planicorne]|nr:hypothetical protein HDU97_004143 [Phlyctochytrium planicorne]